MTRRINLASKSAVPHRPPLRRTKMARKTPRKSNGEATSKSTADVLRSRFEKRLDDVRSRFQSFEKDWSKTVDRLVVRGRNAEKELRSRFDRVARDLSKNDVVARVR